MPSLTREQKAKESRRLLRYKYPAEHRGHYLKIVGEFGRQESETPVQYQRRLAIAYSRATTILVQEHKDEYLEIKNSL